VKRLDGKVAIVTGGARGMGAALLVAEGARVLLANVVNDDGHGDILVEENDAILRGDALFHEPLSQPAAPVKDVAPCQSRVPAGQQGSLGVRSAG
jgi:NAD(P)-dependent dehydrogenase (short-subunit alcohol dehydrogenase family)